MHLQNNGISSCYSMNRHKTQTKLNFGNINKMSVDLKLLEFSFAYEPILHGRIGRRIDRQDCTESHLEKNKEEGLYGFFLILISTFKKSKQIKTDKCNCPVFNQFCCDCSLPVVAQPRPGR